MTRFAFAFLTIVLCSITTTAQDLVTDRPDQTESAESVPISSLQLEMGVGMTLDEGLPDVLDNTLVADVPTVLVRYGIGKTVELRVGGGMILERRRVDVPCGSIICDTMESSSSAAEATVGTKLELVSKGEHLLAVLGTVGMVFGEGDRSDMLAELRLSYATEASSVLSIGINVGGTWSEGEDVVGLYTVAVGVGLSESFGSYFEIFGNGPWEDVQDHSFDTGITWLLSDVTQLDLSAGFGMTRAAPDAMIGLGVSTRFGGR